MRDKQKTPRGDGSRTGFKSLHRGEIRQEDDSKTSHAPQEKCARCPYFPGRGYACNVPCPFTGGIDACSSLRHGEVPQISTKGERHLFRLPRAERTFVRKSFVLKLPAGGVPIGGRFEHIDGNTSSVFREGTATFGRGRGKQVLPSFFNPQVSTEVPHD